MKALHLLTTALGLFASTAYAQPSGDVSIDSKAGKGVIAGAINANGTAQLSPTTFTVAHPSTGRYVITFKTAFAKDAICTYTTVGAATRVAALGVSKTTCDVTFFSLSTNAAVDALFVFIAANAG